MFTTSGARDMVSTAALVDDLSLNLSRYRLLDTLNVVMVGHILYYHFITKYGDPTVFQTPVWCVRYCLPISSVIDM